MSKTARQAEGLIVLFVVSLCRSEAEPSAGGAADRRRHTAKTTLHGRLFQSQRGAIPQHSLRQWPQGASVQPLQTSEDSLRCDEGRGGCNRCLTPFGFQRSGPGQLMLIHRVFILSICVFACPLQAIWDSLNKAVRSTSCMSVSEIWAGR